MAEHLIEKRYTLHKGLNPRQSDLVRPMEYASGMKNAQYTAEGSPEKRKGYQAHSSSVGGFGTFEYNRIDPDTEEEAPEILTVDQNLFTQATSTITISYSGPATSCELSFFYDEDTSVYRFQVIENGTTLLDYSCGMGFDEATTITLDDLRIQINALTGYSATLTGATTTPAAFLKIVRSFNISPASEGSAWVGTAKYWVQVNSPVTNPFSAHYAKRNNLDFENMSGVVINNVMYLSNGFDEVHKYDGQNVYRAGLPNPATLTSTLGSPGSITGSNLFHKIQYTQLDAAGQIHEGNLKMVSAGLNATTEKIDLVIANIQAGTGYNTNCAIVAGAGQNTVNTITVDNGTAGAHTLKVGDTAYFYDSVSSAYITRTVTAVAATTITVSGAAVTVADDAVISNNLRILVWRNKSSALTPALFYLVAELPNNSFAATQAYTDDLADGSLGELLLPPVTDRSPPPKAKYISSFQNHMVLAGSTTYQRRLFWSDIDGPEYFPNDSNQQDVETISGDTLAGIGPNGSVFGVLTDRGTFILSGTLGDNNIRIDQKAGDIGCEAHASIIEMKGVLAWWSARGPYYMANGQIPQPLGTIQDERGREIGRVEPIMIQDGVLTEQRWKTKRIVAINWVDSKKALWFIPAETDPLEGDTYPNSFSRVYAYDYDQDAWLEWANINMAGGVVITDGELYFVEREYSGYSDSVRKVLYRMHNLNDAWDYADNHSGIDWEYSLGWESMGQPSVLKRYIEMKAFALEELPNNEFTMTVSQEINYQKDASSSTFTLDFSGVGFGTSEYGNAPYGDISEGSLRHDLRRERCKSMRLRFTNDELHENCLFSGIEYLVALAYRTEMKV